MYIPRGFAHGFQSLVDDSEVLYQMSEYYHPELACGIRWNDPVLAIDWPLKQPILSERDQRLPLIGRS
jgi:dTDP-4-dehydrorhamnose 3,5-epimerase